MGGGAATGETVDLLIVGGGVFGLWCARRAAQAGLSLRVVEARRIGAGASGGLLGALTAHTPDRWSAKKAFQLAALAALPDEVAALEAETGLSAGYRRAGRVMPIRSESFRAQVDERRRGAARYWAPLDPAFAYSARAREALPAEARVEGWLAEDATPFGCVWDTLAARIDPRAYLAALAASLKGAGAITEGARYLGLEPAPRGARAQLSTGERVAAGAVVIAAGFESGALHPLIAAAAAPLGGVKGRSLLLHAPGYETRPLLYEDGLYIAPHGAGRVAVGSTDETEWRPADQARADADPFEAGRRAAAEDAETIALRARAEALCPPLRGAPLMELWAGVRPKLRSRDPLIGPLDESDRLWTACGGFKIGVGLAHRLAAALIDRMNGARPATPAPERFWTDGGA
ncbi:MAG: FAD-binding oxidoreductase [Pseudomonadota bacterium]